MFASGGEAGWNRGPSAGPGAGLYPSPVLPGQAPLPQALDPSSYPNFPTTATGAAKIMLGSTRQELLEYDRLADLYSILVALDRLEQAYVRDTIAVGDYGGACAKLLAQYRTWMESYAPLIPSVEAFAQEYQLSCGAALSRVRAGIPASVVHGDAETEARRNRSINVMDISERFITAMDALKLNMRAVDELFPSVNEILEHMNRFVGLPMDHDARLRIKKWVVELTAMKASDELTEEQSRQMFFDLETAYNGFRKFLQGAQKDSH